MRTLRGGYAIGAVAGRCSENHGKLRVPCHPPCRSCYHHAPGRPSIVQDRAEALPLDERAHRRGFSAALPAWNRCVAHGRHRGGRDRLILAKPVNGQNIEPRPRDCTRKSSEARSTTRRWKWSRLPILLRNIWSRPCTRSCWIPPRRPVSGPAGLAETPSHRPRSLRRGGLPAARAREEPRARISAQVREWPRATDPSGLVAFGSD